LYRVPFFAFLVCVGLFLGGLAAHFLVALLTEHPAQFAAVALFGSLVGTTELVSRYRDKPTAPLGTWPGIIYIATNALASIAALLKVLKDEPRAIFTAAGIALLRQPHRRGRLRPPRHFGLAGTRASTAKICGMCVICRRGSRQHATRCGPSSRSRRPAEHQPPLVVDLTVSRQLRRS
jgi:hypothetical protein